ncbi:MAG: hypothetical protein QF645_01995 [Planctomycetota bacterium]|nr:hypothetical protein [Planctomycetota bacterium]
MFTDDADSLGFLEGFVGTAFIGGRFRMGSYFLETSVGMGLTDESSDWTFTMGFTIPIGTVIEPVSQSEMTPDEVKEVERKFEKTLKSLEKFAEENPSGEETPEKDEK